MAERLESVQCSVLDVRTHPFGDEAIACPLVEAARATTYAVTSGTHPQLVTLSIGTFPLPTYKNGFSCVNYWKIPV